MTRPDSVEEETGLDIDLLKRVERFIQKPHYGPKRLFLLVDVQQAIAKRAAPNQTDAPEGGNDGE